MKQVFDFYCIFNNKKSNIMKSLLFLIMIFAVISCNDNPVIVQEPTSDNIFFTPDTIKITESYQNIKVIFKGVNFLEYKIDSIFIENIQITITSKTKDSLITNIAKLVTGTFDVNLFYNGKKITLNKKLVIINPLLDFDINKCTKLNFEINNFICKKYSYSLETHWGEGKPNISYSDQSYTNTSYTQINLSNPIMTNLLTYRINGPYVGYYDFNYLLIEFSTTKRILKSLEYNYQHFYVYDNKYNHTDLLKYKFENIPYTITTKQNGDIELLIDIQGKEIDNYFPLIYIHNKMDQVVTGNYRSNSEEYFITKKDSVTGKEINYYPANDSSRIKFVLY